MSTNNYDKLSHDEFIQKINDAKTWKEIEDLIDYAVKRSEKRLSKIKTLDDVCETV